MLKILKTKKTQSSDKKNIIVLSGSSPMGKRDGFVSIEFTDISFHRLFFAEFTGVSLMAIHAGIYMILGVPTKRVARHLFFIKYYWPTWQTTIERYSESGYVGYVSIVRIILREAQRIEINLKEGHGAERLF